ncbi:prolyl oligopeptidase family serine peptidase [Altererythrobacter aerius]|uniref:Prolyl oligopeptidase family serine peptidase n=1 Tax=Tsuneonella aeria TaxID=1837929 RepID=A0A6I4TDZ2_9SPHN|nr:S9 family peptidase [Tsuneonella aeria]MXO74598.1 prolyl oligopeptidase family serine peptidase [Tsuneonella aeria]
MNTIRTTLAIAASALALAGCTTMQETPMTTAASTAPAAAPARSAQAAPLIPRTVLFGNPTRSAGRISPDGKWLSWLAPSNGVMNVWVAPAAQPAAAKVMTTATDRPIRQYFWSPDSSQVLYIQDKGGDENWLLYGIDVLSGKETALTPFEKTTVQLVGASTVKKDKLLIGLNNRDARYHDVWLLDLKTGKLTEVMRNEQYAGFLADNNLDIRMALRPNAAGGMDYFTVTGGKVAEKPMASTGLADSLTTMPAGYTSDGKTLYWLDSRDRNTAALVAVDTATGKQTVIAENARADIGGTLSNPITGQVEAYSVEYLKREWTATDPAVKASLDWLDSKLDGQFSVLSRTDDDSRWVVANDPVVAPATTWLYDRKAGTLTEFYTARPDLVGAPLQPMHALEVPARDGKTLVSYLTLPPGSDGNADGVPDAPVPMVLLVHGGPWARDSFGYNSAHQWLANRGYAVMSVNFRGSTGLGKDFIEAGNLQWGRDMQTDLDDAMDWAVARGVTSKDKVAIMGGSYGGYATLAGLAFTPERYACGVDIVGPSNLETLLKTIPPYWAPVIAQFHERMGNPGTAEGLALLKERSPLYSADKIVRPLLIGQGANDPRVNQAESDQIVEAMKAKGIPVTYVLFPDEGHGFAKPANNIAFNAVAENFLATCLGGRAEPIGDTVARSTAKIVEGAAYVKGLGD